MSLGTALPYGLRDIKIVKYPDLAATSFGTLLIDLPNAQTFEFTETEDYDDLRGDDRLVTSHGQSPQLDCSLESGGISLDAYTALNGGMIIESGVTPNQTKRYRKLTTDIRPFVTVMGQSISDSGGDFHGVAYRCRVTGDLGGEQADATFYIPSASLTGYGCNVDGDLDGEPILDALYDFAQHEAITALVAPALDTPSAPTVTSLSDITGPAAGGEIVRVFGTRFTGTVSVAMTATAVTEWELVSDRELIIVTPAKTAGVSNVRVTNATGQSATGAGNVYTYV